MIRTALLLVVSGSLVGCGSRRPEADVERGRAAVGAALDAWKVGESPAKLKALPDPVEFSDELQRQFALTEYTLGRVDATDKDVIRYTVTLKLRDKQGKLTDREVTYSVALKSPVVVARDPYY